MGEKERIEYRDAAPDIKSWETDSLVPTGLSPNNGNNNLNQRNTFYWDKKAMQLYAGDYTKARLTHWLYANNSFYVIDGIPESTKNPLESRVWFNYGGQTDARQAGTTGQPNRIARVLDDGTTQTRQFAYDTYGKLTNSVDA